MLRADPISTFRSFRTHAEFDIENDLNRHDSGDDAATRRCASATRDAFGIEPLGKVKGGLNEIELIALQKQFFQYVIDLKKNFSLLPTTFSPSADFPTDSSKTTSPPADFTSTLDEHSYVPPAALLKALAERSELTETSVSP